MTTRNLAEAILDGGIRSVNFFNGRLLSGEDLSQEQEANSDERKRLGQAIGDGIVTGLEVARSTTAGNSGAPVVTVQPGLAINRMGQTLALTKSVDMSLVSSSAGATTSTQSLFATCTPPQSGPYIAGAGVYLLTIAPATGSEGRAPVSGLGNVSAFCNTRYNIEGVQFHLLQVNVAQSELQDSNHLRNRLAYACFGTSDALVQTFLQNPLGSSMQQGYGLLDMMRQGSSSAAACLSDEDVPLALLYWTVDAGIAFIDLWSVRRRVTRPSADIRWPLFISDRRLSEAEAMFLQFQEQIAQITSPATSRTQLTQIGVLDYFRYLPAVGIIPFANSRLSRGFDYLRFFQGIPYRDPVFIEGAKVEHLIRDSLSYQPVKLNSDPDKQEMIWLYLVRENMQAIAESAFNPPQAYMVFTSGHIPYQGDAQYNLARWSYSNYSLTMAH
jgi:hypothetical protein